MASPFDKLTSNPKRLFLVDGLGALLSVLFLGMVLPYYEGVFGVPKAVLLPLAGMAGVFAVYSLGCSFFMPRKWPVFLYTIAVANLLYAAYTTFLVFISDTPITFLGQVYFWAELAVLSFLIVIEITVASTKPKIE